MTLEMPPKTKYDVTQFRISCRNCILYHYPNTNKRFSRLARETQQVLFVAMDEVAFDFMDALSPGCTTMLPAEGMVSKPESNYNLLKGRVVHMSPYIVWL